MGPQDGWDGWDGLVSVDLIIRRGSNGDTATSLVIGWRRYSKAATSGEMKRQGAEPRDPREDKQGAG